VARRAALPGVGHVLAVHSGKGGVGKSTIAVNLAVAIAAPPPAGQGLRVGLLWKPAPQLIIGRASFRFSGMEFD
jgi:hypothetical protein